jgi:hypothetical protein
MQDLVESDKVVGRKIGNNGLKSRLKKKDISLDMSYFQNEFRRYDECGDIVR